MLKQRLSQRSRADGDTDNITRRSETFKGYLAVTLGSCRASEKPYDDRKRVGNRYWCVHSRIVSRWLLSP